MFFQVQIQYRTPAGEYCVAECNLDHPQVYHPNDYVQRWTLEHLPEGSFVVSVKMGWAILPPEEVILRRFDIGGSNSVKSDAKKIPSVL